jgi:sugar lactone lactonase YvrE
MNRVVVACVASLFAAAVQAGTIETVAGDGNKANVGQPFGVEFGPDGALYICDVENHRIHRHDMKTGKTTVIAGTGKKGNSGDGGPATKAELSEPYEIRFDSDGNLSFVDMVANCVRKIDVKTQVITTIAGTGKKGFSGDGGPATKAEFSSPHSIALDGKGSLYIADILNHRIRRVDLKSGIVTTWAGTGEKKLPVDGQKAAGHPILGPRALCIDGDTMWIALREGNSIWKASLTDGVLHHISGTGKSGFSGDGGSAAKAMLAGPKGIALSKDGVLYIADTENQAIRAIDTKTLTITTLAGAGPKAKGYGGDGGPATEAKMDRPHGVCVGPDGLVYIGDTNNHRVRRVNK